MKALTQDFRMGIIGGGQLGRMLLQVCPNFNLHTSVLDPGADGPCSTLATEYVQGSLQDFDSVYSFGKQVDLLTIELENVNTQALYQLEEEGVTVHPQPRVIETIQDKRVQKQFYVDHGLPTAEFVLVENRQDVQRHGGFLPAFNKLANGGYDGGGVQSLITGADIGKAFDAPGLLEKTVDIAAEISVIAARNAQGEVRVYPAVECVFHPRYNLVDYLIAPCSLDAAIQEQAAGIATRLITELGAVGLLAVEIFVTRAGEVLINEVAPRPHNSGHQTINANDTSQYEQHLRAILGLPLGSTALNKPCALVNLLGAEGYTGTPRYEGIDKLLEIEGVNLTLYGKAETRPHRKMGHITVLNDDVTALQDKVQLVKEAMRVIA